MAFVGFNGSSLEELVEKEAARVAEMFEEDVELGLHDLAFGHVVFSVDKVNGVVPGHRIAVSYEDDGPTYDSPGFFGHTADNSSRTGSVKLFDLGPVSQQGKATVGYTDAHLFMKDKVSLAEMLAERYEKSLGSDRRDEARKMAEEALGVAASPEDLRRDAELLRGDVIAYANEVTHNAFASQMDFERACAVIGYEPGKTTDAESWPEHFRRVAEKAIELEERAESIESARVVWKSEPWLLKGGAAEKELCVSLSSPGLYFAELPMSGRVTVQEVALPDHSSCFVAYDANSWRTSQGSWELVEACLGEMCGYYDLSMWGLDEDLSLSRFAEVFCRDSEKFEISGPQALFEAIVDAIGDPALHNVWQVDDTWKPSFEWEVNKGREFLANGWPEPRVWEPQGGEVEKNLCRELSAGAVLFAELPVSGHVSVQEISTNLTYGAEDYVFVAYDAETRRSAEESLNLCKACVEELLPDAPWVEHGLDAPYFDEMTGEALESVTELDKHFTLLEFAREYAEFYPRGHVFFENPMKVYEAVADAFRAPGLNLDRDWKSAPGKEKGSAERKPGELKSAGKPPKQPTGEVGVCPDSDMEVGKHSSSLRNDLEHARAAVAAINAGKKK